MMAEPVKKRRIAFQCMYFGLRFFYSSIEIEVSEINPIPERIKIMELESLDLTTEGKQLIKHIQADMRALKRFQMGGKVDWKWQSGCFELLDKPDVNVYVYHHPCHVSCSKVKYSDIVSTLNVLEVDHKFLDGEADGHTCSHGNHYRLQPFFLDNWRLMHFYEICARKDDEATQLLTELKDVEHKIETDHKLVQVETEFNHPAMALPNNWEEDDWTKRLNIGLKKTFKVDTNCGAGRKEFKEVIDFLGVPYLDKGCFIFRGRPDIIIQRTSAVISASASASDDSSDDSGDDSSDVKSTVENSWQRTPLKGATHTQPAEKLGELISGLYILLVAKIVRRVHQQKNFHQLFKVKGVLLDKAAVSVMCTLAVDLTHSGAMLSVKLSDYMGTLDSKTLCYLIRILISDI